MDKSLKLKEILERNPSAKSQSDVIEQAIDFVRQLREFGRTPHNYGLEGPFGDRLWLKRSSHSATRKLTEHA